MKNIRDEIVDFVSINDQEIADRQLALECIDKFEDIFSRENKSIHFVTSALVLNKDRNKVLMTFHNIFKSWGWVGGHADEEKDLFNVVKKEITEETGIKFVNPLSSCIFSLETLPVLGHFKNGEYISPHRHISVDYVFEADEKEPLLVKADENSEVGWMPIEKMVSLSNESHMQLVYKKIINRLMNVGLFW